MLHNMMYAEEMGFTKGINHMSDWTEEEYQKLLGSAEESDLDDEEDPVYLHGDNAPTAVDWRNSGAVTGVKN